MNVLDSFVELVHSLAERIAKKPDVRWAVVTGTVPLAIRFDTETAPISGTPSTLVAGLTIGDRVLVIIQNRRVTILGRGGG